MINPDQVYATTFDENNLNAVDAVKIHSIMISGYRATFIRLILTLNVIIIVLWQHKNPFTVFKILIALKAIRKKVHGLSGVKKYVRSQGRYFWSENILGWPSKAFSSHIKSETLRALKTSELNVPMQTVIWAISNSCPFRCSHCCEWNNLAPVESLSLNNLKLILGKLTDFGLHHIQLSGGEPLARFDDLLCLLKSAEKGIDYWILTSGYGLTYQQALLLKRAGLAGANISLDHWDENVHNEFRNNHKSFYWARQAAEYFRKADILISLSLCAAKSFISDENLWKYINLAKEWGAGFIRIIEPKMIGNYAEKDVLLRNEHIETLNNFYQSINSSSKFREYPIVMYPGYHQRKAGCFGAGDRYFYIDPVGDIHACPFCRGKTGNAIRDPLYPAIASLKNIGCPEFKMSIAG
jgi:MoaA/NifB/PqqE/SkfB family radical SAM enzyme